MRSRRRDSRWTTGTRCRRPHPASASSGIMPPSIAPRFPGQRSPNAVSANRQTAQETPMLTRSSLTIRLHPADDVVIARQQLVGGTKLLDEDVTIVGLVPPGHKVATRAIAVGEPVRRYNQIIGFASRAVAPGEHVHLHNLAMGDFARDYAIGVDVKPTDYIVPAATFQGIVRRDGPNAGKVAT